ncbi:MAG: NUDIX hydrolase [Pseudomonadota bacterium]
MTPAPTRLAATILLVRDGPNGAEIGMVARNAKMDFAGGALVFPGGSVDEGDRAARSVSDGVEGLSDEAAALRAAAIREAFEECGVLLARRGGALVSGAEAADLVASWRRRLEAREVGIAEMAAAEGLMLASDLIAPFAHWITPEAERKRFDTHFLIAEAPAGQALSYDGGEAVDAVWTTPEAAMAAARAGERALMFPTWLNLQVLAGAENAAEALAKAAAHPPVSVMPTLTRADAGFELRIPAEAGYGHAAYLVRGFAAEPEPIA